MAEPLELDEVQRRALSDQYGPTPGAKSRVLDGLRAQLGGPGGPGGSGGSGEGGGTIATSGVGQAAWAAKIVAATLGLTASGLLTIKLGALALGPSAAPASASHDATTVSTDTASQPTRALHTTAAEPTLELTPAADQAAPAQPTPRRHEVAAPPGPAETGDLAAELALLHAAEQWRDNDPHAALAKLEQHRSEFSTGALAPEREVLRVELLCALGRHAQASAAHEAFMATRSDPQLRARIDASCVGTGFERSGN
jgi:hypothetical protein